MSLPNIILSSQEVELVDGSKVTMDVNIRASVVEFVETLAKKHPIGHLHRQVLVVTTRT